VGTFGALMAYNGYIWTVLKWNDRKPMLPVPSGMDFLPLVIAGVLVVLFTIEHVIALVQGKEVVPAWN
jgi:TRAP-type C4-dicarboxylate transport system permease small subunit